MMNLMSGARLLGEEIAFATNEMLDRAQSETHLFGEYLRGRDKMAASTSSASLYAFDIMALDGDDLRGLPLSMRKTNLARLLARRPEGIFVAPFEQGEIGPDLFRAACDMGVRGTSVEAPGSTVSRGPVEVLDQSEEPQASSDGQSSRVL